MIVEQLSSYFISRVFFWGRETWEKREGWLDIGAVVCAEGFRDLAWESQGLDLRTTP